MTKTTYSMTSGGEIKMSILSHNLTDSLLREKGQNILWRIRAYSLSLSLSLYQEKGVHGFGVEYDGDEV